jgi:hypothetical protein
MAPGLIYSENIITSAFFYILLKKMRLKSADYDI